MSTTIPALIHSVLDESEAAKFADDKKIRHAGLELRRQVGHVRGHAGAGHNHGDRADRARVGTQTVANALVSVDDDRLAPDHGQHVAFGADAGAGAAANAVVVVDVRMLRLGAFGKQFAFLRGLESTGFLLLQALKIDPDEEEGDQAADSVSDESIHGRLRSIQGRIEVRCEQEPARQTRS